MARLNQLTQALGGVASWFKGGAQNTRLDRGLYNSLLKDGMDPTEAGKIATTAKGGLISGAAKLGLGLFAANALSGGGVTGWLGNQAQKILGETEQTQAYHENLNAQTQGINRWVGILSFINAIFPTKFVTDMIDARLQKVAEINDRMKENATGAFTADKNQGLVDRTIEGFSKNDSADITALVGLAGTSVVSKVTTGSWNPLNLAMAPISWVSGKISGTRNSSAPVVDAPSSVKLSGSPGTPDGGPTSGGSRTSTAAAADVAEEVAEDTAKAGSKLARHGGKLALGAAVLGGATVIADQVMAAPVARTGSPDIDAPKTGVELGTMETTMLGAMTGEAAYGMTKGASLIAKEGGEFALKRVPLIGGLVTAGFAAVAAGRYAWAGEYGRAGAELGTGLVEGVVNTTGLGLIGAGDAAREAIRLGVSEVAGEEYAPDKSGLRTIIEYGTGTGDFGPSPSTSVNDFKAAVANSPIVVSPEMAEAAAPQEMQYDAMGNSTGFAPLAMGGSFAASAAPAAQPKAHDAISPPQPKRTRRAQAADATPGVHIQ